MDFSLSSFLLGVVMSCVILGYVYNKLLKSKLGIEQELGVLKSIRAEEIKSREKEKQFIETSQQQLADSFKVLSAQALTNSNTAFFELAKNTFEHFQACNKQHFESQQTSIQVALKPIQENLKHFQDHIHNLEKSRLEAYTSITEQIKGLLSSQFKLEAQTVNLVKALRMPNVRGQWGEMHLRKTVEIAGMLSHVDFLEQVSFDNEGGGRQRPDMLIKLPNNKTVIVDAKAPLISYLDAIEAADPQKAKDHFMAHARLVKDHLQKLGSKHYWKQLDCSPEFVILFLPGESFFSAALEHDPSLIEFGIEQKVLLATPTTLIALLKTVAYGWQQEKLNQEAKVISNLGRELYERMNIFGYHFSDLKKNIEKTVYSFNKSLISIESRLLPIARKFNQLSVPTTKPFPELTPLDTVPTQSRSPELEYIDSDN